MRQREVEEVQAACQAFNEFVTKLEITPDDPNCNLHVGMYEVFLARGMGPRLAELGIE